MLVTHKNLPIQYIMKEICSYKCSIFKYLRVQFPLETSHREYEFLFIYYFNIEDQTV